MFATFHGDDAAARKFSLTTRTIQRYRKEAIDDPKLSGIVAYRLSMMEGADIPDEIASTISGLLKTANHLCTLATAGNHMPKAEDILALAEIMKIIFSYDLNRKQLHLAFGFHDGVAQ
jgi:hypothetical protein